MIFPLPFFTSLLPQDSFCFLFYDIPILVILVEFPRNALSDPTLCRRFSPSSLEGPLRGDPDLRGPPPQEENFPLTAAHRVICHPQRAHSHLWTPP